MEDSTKMTVAVVSAVAAVVAAAVLAVLLQQARDDRQACEAARTKVERRLDITQVDAASCTAELQRVLEQERALRSAQDRDCGAAAATSRKELARTQEQKKKLTQALEQAQKESAQLTQALEQVRGEHRVALAAAAEQAGALRQERDALQQQNSNLNSTLQELSDARQQAVAAHEALRRQHAAQAEQLDALQARLTSGAPAGQVEVTRQADEVRIAILGEVLFASGSRRLKPRGREVLAALAPALQTLPGEALVQVIGHADAQPILPRKRWLMASNLELSAARAAAVAEVLPRLAAVDPARFYAMGRADLEPAADNTTPEGRARNRRVVIRIVHAPQHPLERAWLGGH